jgi:pentatricopeptide repeat protein
MRSEGIAMNAIASIYGLRACSDDANIGMGQALHDEIVRKGFIDSCFLPVASSLIDMYARGGMLKEARAMHDAIASKHQDVVSWTALVRGYAEHGYGEEALESYEQMLQEEEVLPDAFVMSCALAASGGLGALGKGYGIHSDALKRSLDREAFVAERLVDMYARCGSPKMAEAVFNLVPEAAVAASSWNVLISAYAQLGDSGAVFAHLQRMAREEDVVQLDAITFLHALTVCSYCGLLLEAQKCFVEMVHWNCIQTIEHFACVVDMLGRAGQIDEAVELIERIPYQPNAVVWHALLAAACRNEAHLGHGIFAFRQALAVNQRDAAAYVSMSNACIQNASSPGRICSRWIAESGTDS